jgi:hypothetical protein
VDLRSVVAPGTVPGIALLGVPEFIDVASVSQLRPLVYEEETMKSTIRDI